MEMTRVAPILGLLGAALAVAGLVIYSLTPEKLWLITLCEGLALVGLISFFVMHFEAVKAFSIRRSTRLGANSVLMVVLLVGILGIANFLGARHTIRWDLSETQRFTLSPQTYKVLRDLDREVSVTVFSQEESSGYTRYRDLLGSYRAETPKLSVEFVDPERQPGIARKYGINRLDTAVLESGGQSSRVSSASEAELTGALIRVTRETKKRVVFLEGHGERDLNSQERDGLSLAKDALIDQGYEVDTVSLLAEPEVPKETSVLVIAGPRRQLPPDERDRIGAYVEGGGRLLVLVDPETKTGLPDLLARWGVELGPGVLIDPRDRLARGAPTALMVRTFTEHEITHDFNFAVLFPVSQRVSFNEGAGAGWTFVPLARTSPQSWVETSPIDKEVSFDAQTDRLGPHALAAAMTPMTDEEPKGKENPDPALVIVGNSAFATNAYINFPGNTDFFLHTIGWLAEERNLISITPKEPAFRPFVPNPMQEQLLLYLQVLLLPMAALVVGYLIRRKRKHL